MSAQTVSTPDRLKLITSYAGSARWHAEVEEGSPGEVDSSLFPKQPYRFSQRLTVLIWKGRPVVMVEVGHLRFEVYAVDPSTIVPAEG